MLESSRFLYSVYGFAALRDYQSQLSEKEQLVSSLRASVDDLHATLADVKKKHQSELEALAAETKGSQARSVIEVMAAENAKREAAIAAKVSELEGLHRQELERANNESRARLSACEEEWRLKFDRLSADRVQVIPVRCVSVGVCLFVCLCVYVCLYACLWCRHFAIARTAGTRC